MIFHCYGMLKATKKSISLLQSNCPLIKTMIVLYSPWGLWRWMVPTLCPTIAQDCLLSRADINKLV